MPTVDTNVLLRWLLDDVPEQTAAAGALLTGEQRCVVPDVALIETVFVLDRVLLLSRPTIARSVEAILAVANLDLDRSVWRAALDDYLDHPKLSISDTFLAAQASASGRLPLYTFDKKLANQLVGVALLS